MSTALLEPPAEATPKQRFTFPTRKPIYRGLRMTLEEYLDWEPEHEDGWKYEWCEGTLVSEELGMKEDEVLILVNIGDAFAKTRYQAEGGRLVSEVTVPLPGKERARRPDLCFFTRDEMRMMRDKKSLVPRFVIEIISTHDGANHLEDKLRDYFAAGVQCVWLVFPRHQSVRVFRSVSGGGSFSGAEEVGAEPALPEFRMRVEQMFAA